MTPKQTTEAVGLSSAAHRLLAPTTSLHLRKGCATHQGLQQHGARIGLGRVAKLVQPLDHPIEVTSPLVALRLERNPARRSCHAFGHNAVWLQLHALAYNLANFLRTLGLPEEIEHWSLTTLREKLVKIGARIVRHVVFQLAEVAVPRALFEILRRIDRLWPPPRPA